MSRAKSSVVVQTLCAGDIFLKDKARAETGKSRPSNVNEFPLLFSFFAAAILSSVKREPKHSKCLLAGLINLPGVYKASNRSRGTLLLGKLTRPCYGISRVSVFARLR